MEVHDFLDSAGVAAAGTDGHMCLAAGVQEMSEQLQLEEYRHLNLAPYETHPRILRRILIKSGEYSVPNALSLYLQWVSWRRENDADAIPREVIQRYIDRREAVWTGKSRTGMRCCFVTGRRHQPLASTRQTFRQYMLHVVEEGCLHDEGGETATPAQVEPTTAAGAEPPAQEETINITLDEAAAEHATGEANKVCVIYDRRGMEYSHIDPVAFQASTSLVGDLQRFYGDCVGAIYIVHVNLLFWAAYRVLRPLLQLFNGDKLVILYEARDILQYVDESELPEGFLDDAQE